MLHDVALLRVETRLFRGQSRKEVNNAAMYWLVNSHGIQNHMLGACSESAPVMVDGLDLQKLAHRLGAGKAEAMARANEARGLPKGNGVNLQLRRRRDVIGGWLAASGLPLLSRRTEFAGVKAI